MFKRGYKLIISVVLVSTLFIVFSCSVFAAEPAWLIRAKSAIAATLLAGNLILEPVNIITSDPLAQAIDPFNIVEQVSDTTWLEYLDQSVIVVQPDVVTIDGVPYSDIWLGPDAAQNLRLAGLDFVSAYNILNNQDNPISYASGDGFLANTPFYSVNGVIRTQNFLVNDTLGLHDMGVYQVRVDSQTQSVTRFVNKWYNTQTYSSTQSLPNSNFPITYYFDKSGNTINMYRQLNGQSMGFAGYINASDYISSPFSFNYTSGVIDVPISPDDGLLIRVPSSYTNPDPDITTYNYDIHDLVNIYPSVTQPGGHEINIDPSINPDFETDVDLGNGVGDLIRTILNILDLLDNFDIDFAPEPDAPQPVPVDPDPAVPDVPVGEQDGSWLDQLLRWIKNGIDTISQSIIDAKDYVVNELQDLNHQLSSLPQQILEDIETGPAKVFRKALDILKSIFLPLLLPIKAMMNLWHYVVEWLVSVTTPFAWIFGVMSATSYNMVLPIYAALAGGICIAIYKALGR